MGEILWTEKYRPVKYSDLIFTDEVQHTALEWLKSFPFRGKHLLINGPTGVGKTSLVHILTNLFKYNLVEFNNDINLSKLPKYNNTVDNKKNLILVDDVSDPNVVRKIIKSKLDYPVIITSEYIFNNDICTINISKPDIITVKKILEKILDKEKLILDATLVSKVIESSNYDVRSVINYLQLISYNPRIGNQKDYKCIPNNPINDSYKIFSKDMRWDHIRRNILDISYNSYVHNIQHDINLYEISNDFSFTSSLPECYYILPLIKINRTRSRRTKIVKYLKYSEIRRNVNKEEILPYILKYNIKTQFNENIQHLNEILNTLSFEDSYFNTLAESNEDYRDLRNIKKLVIKNLGLKMIEESQRVFKYIYKRGGSCFAKKYLSLSEFLRL